MKAAALGAIAVVRPILFLAVVVIPGAARAQAPAAPNPSNGWDNAYFQIMAESLSRAGLRKWVYTSDGYPIGRIADVRTSPDGMHEVAIVGVRRLLGGGDVAFPIYRLSRRNGRIVARDDRAAVRAMARLDAEGGRR